MPNRGYTYPRVREIGRKMKYVNLHDICKPKQWKTISISELHESGFPVYGANGKIGFYDEYTHKEPTLMITCRGATCGNLHISEPYSYINGNAMALDDLDENVVLSYLYFYLQHRGFDDVITGSAQPQITGQGLQKVKVFLPDLPTQTQIAKILDKSTALIAKRKAQIAELDSLVQSVFYNLFLSTKKYSTIKLGNIANHISSGSTPKGGREVYKTSGVLFIRSQNVLMNEIIYDDISFIDENTHKTMKRSQLKKNDVLLNITGASIGRVAVFEGEDDSANTNQHVAAIRISDKQYLPYFISYFIASDYQQNIIKGICNGGTREALNYQQIRDFDIPQVPLDEQKFFLKIVQKIQTQKSHLQQSLAELETQHQALMQRAFRGELV